ncbi:sialidase [[Haemophilus] felis]|uniref:exo-alpha-sialidase n=1 Tax=[Haemophilus] felis TaxID=123822 RepID=A0A1T0B567_9PAST|nr:sialidase [[Haemophilus] felis]NBI41063.1 sialidase [[Haemophilus] felis]OOS05278.1 sialidase [[Haemophilus] felis]
MQKIIAFPLSFLALSLSLPLSASQFFNPNLNENLTHITKRTGVDNFKQYVAGKPWPGVGPNGEAAGTAPLSYARIPAMTITDDNKLVVMFDLRWNSATDQNRIDPGIAISEDGGYSWTRKTAWTFDKGEDPLRRAMDPTILHNAVDGSLYALHGTWASGNQNWYQNRVSYYNNNIWAATIHKSTDGGKTWEKNAQFAKGQNEEIFKKVQKGAGNYTVGFLGGVGSGIVMRDGTLVFPIQTAHDKLQPSVARNGKKDNTNGGIAASIMFSKDNGKTWQMSETTTPVAPNQISLENMVFEIGDKLVMTGREDRCTNTCNTVPQIACKPKTNCAKNRWAYYTTDLGKTWEKYEYAEFGSSTAQPTQGSSIYVTLPNGRRVLLVSKPNGNHDNWGRGNLALHMLDAKNKNHHHEVAIIRPGSGNPAGAGYSSLAYKEGNLFIAYEDDGDIRIRNITEYLSAIQAKALEWNLPDEIETEVAKINAFEHLNKGQKAVLTAKMRRANDDSIPQSHTINNAMHELKTNTATLHENAKTLMQGIKVLPSRQRHYALSLDNIHRITSPNDTTFVNYLGVYALYDNLYARYLALNTKLNFEPYVKHLSEYNEYNLDVLYQPFSPVFAQYETGSKYNRLSAGINKEINPNLNVGAFVEHRHRKQNSYEVGVRAKYVSGNHQLAGFVRLRALKKEGFGARNRNVDSYINYAYSVRANKELSLSPAMGVYASHSARTLMDEDLAINQRLVYGADVGVNIAYQLGELKVNLRPNIAFVNDGATLSQSNDATNTHKVKSHSLVYSLNVGVEKQFAKGLTLGSELKLQKYGSQRSETNMGVNLSYKF